MGPLLSAEHKTIYKTFANLASRGLLVWCACFYTLTDAFVSTVDPAVKVYLGWGLVVVSSVFIIMQRYYDAVDRKSPPN